MLHDNVTTRNGLNVGKHTLDEKYKIDIYIYTTVIYSYIYIYIYHSYIMKHSIAIYIYMSMSQLLNTPLSSCAIYLSKNLWKIQRRFHFSKCSVGGLRNPLGRWVTRQPGTHHQRKVTPVAWQAQLLLDLDENSWGKQRNGLGVS